MLGLAHVALHVGLCSAMKPKAPEAPVAIRVRLINSIKEVPLDKTFTVQRGYDQEVTVEFDSERGVYHLQVDAPQFHCSATDWLIFYPNLDRNVNVSLAPGVAKLTEPMLIFGELPQEFQSAQPQFELFDSTLNACNKPITDPLPSHIDAESDTNAYYAWLYSDPAINAHGSVTLALRLKNAGEFRYIRIPMKFPEPWHGWPVMVQFDLDQRELISIPSMKIDTLLCPRFVKTSVG
jgi:hypothetical protein